MDRLIRSSTTIRCAMSPGPSHDADTTTVVATVPPGTLSLSTTMGLDNHDEVASFKVFVRLTTGNETGSNNEAGSNAVTIARP